LQAVGLGTKDVIDLCGGSASLLLLIGAGVAFARTRLELRRLRATIMADSASSPAPTPEALAPYNRRVGTLEVRTRNLAMLGAIAIGGLGVTGLRRLMGHEPPRPTVGHADRNSSKAKLQAPDAAPYKEPAWASSTEAGVWQAGNWAGTVLRAFPATRSLCRQNCELRLHECVAASHDGTTCVLYRQVERSVKARSARTTAGTTAETIEAWRPPPPR
jgi:hypothetical protein